MMGELLVWYLVLQGFALVGLPLAFAWLWPLSSRGYAVAKALGLVLTGVVVWWGGIARLWGNTNAATLTAAGLVLALGLWAMRHRWRDVIPWWREHRTFVLTVEVLFLVALVLWAVVRASQPQLETAGGEKWMEIAFLNAVLRAPHLPPHDPWLSGYAISYYYLGYLLLGMLTRLAALPATVAFNLGGAAWFALAAVGAYGIVYDLLARRDVLPPLLAPLLLLLTGNGEGLLEVLHARGLLPAAFWRWLNLGKLAAPPEPPFQWVPHRFFWWWQASRTLQDVTPWGDHQEVIDEFPAFSFTLGDMHPHVLALPFVLLVITLALSLYRRARQRGRAPSLWARVSQIAGYAVVLGTLGFLNTWDLPIYWVLMVGALVLGVQAHAGDVQAHAGDPEGTSEGAPSTLLDAAWRVAPDALALGVLSIVVYLPFWAALRSQAGGILPNLFNATRWPHFVIMFAPLLVPVIGVVVTACRRTAVAWYQPLLWGVALTLGVALLGLLVGLPTAWPYLRAILQGTPVQGITMSPEVATAALLRRLSNPWVGLALGIAVGAALLALLRAEQGHPLPEARRFPLLMALVGLLLTLAPEFVYLQDVFTTRMNTIFKFYFQAWVLWSLAGAWQVARWLTRQRTPRRLERRPALAALALVMVAVGLVYTVLAVPARAREHGVPWTLDGAAWMAQMHPHDHDAIAWLNAHVAGTPTGTPVILEAPGDQHASYVYQGRVAALTGLPTLLGWGGHQRQWRGNYEVPARREEDLATLWTTESTQETLALLRRYDVRYVYVGPVERQRYPAEGLAKFAAMFPVAYANEGVTIYHVPPAGN
jgi:YYY domain-containing protein